jgi:DNA polymerase-3 subunit delta
MVSKMPWNSPKSKPDTDAYAKLSASIKTGELEQCYIFHGPERYLLERGISDLRAHLCPDGTSSFNYRRFEGDSLDLFDIKEAVNTFPMFAEKTLIEIHDFDIFKASNSENIRDILLDLPDYICLVFSYDTKPFKPDKRLKLSKEILELSCELEFAAQESKKLVRWIIKHFKDAGRDITTADSEYLAFITDGLMTNLRGEIEKVAAYTRTEMVTRKDIDAVVTPTLDAISFHLTDAILNKNHKQALKLLDELFQMRESPHMLIGSISKSMRQLLAARVCLENKMSQRDFIEISSVKPFPAEKLMKSARNSTLADCRRYVLACSETAQELNSMREPESRLTELVTRLALGE